MRVIRISISDDARALLPHPTGIYADDEAAIAAALTSNMIPVPPSHVYEFVQWEIAPPDDVYAVFELRQSAINTLSQRI